MEFNKYIFIKFIGNIEIFIKNFEKQHNLEFIHHIDKKYCSYYLTLNIDYDIHEYIYNGCTKIYSLDDILERILNLKNIFILYNNFAENLIIKLSNSIYELNYLEVTYIDKKQINNDYDNYEQQLNILNSDDNILECPGYIKEYSAFKIQSVFRNYQLKKATLMIKSWLSYVLFSPGGLLMKKFERSFEDCGLELVSTTHST